VTTLADAIARLRDGVAAGGSGAPRSVADTVFRDPHFEFGNATVTPIGSTTVGDLEEILGTARRLPRNPSGGDRTVLFVDTLPAEGGSGATVLAEIDDDDRVRRVIVRADSY
jgi:hypothetical protein